jgi:hypothetical protein
VIFPPDHVFSFAFLEYHGESNTWCIKLYINTALAFAANCARAHFTSKWPMPSLRPPQRRPTLLLRACIYCALGGERCEATAEETKKKEKKIQEEEEESSQTHH